MLTMQAIPAIDNRYRSFLILLAIFSLSVFGFSLEWSYDRYGDVTTTAAQRVFAGQIPYRDFWTLYAPGSFYLLAFLYYIFGQHIFVGIVASSILCAASACLCYQLAYRLTDKRLLGVSVAAIFFSATFSTVYYKSLGPYPPVIFFVLISLNLILNFYRTQQEHYLFWAGIATGAAVLFKHDVAGYTAFSILIGLAVYQVIESGSLSRQCLVAYFRRAFIYSAGILLIALPVAIYFIVVAGPDMRQDLIVFPGTDFRFARPEKYPGILPIGIYDKQLIKTLFRLFRYLSFVIPFFVLLAGIFSLGIVAARKNRHVYFPMGLTFAFGFLFHYGSAHIQINTNIISMSTYAALLGVLSYEVILNYSHFTSRSFSFVKIAAGLFVTLWCASLAFKPGFAHFSRQDSEYVTLNLPKVSGMKIRRDNAANLIELTNYIQKNVPPTEKVFLGAHRHDALLIGDSGVYFLIDRINPTRQDQLHPGVVDRKDIQEQMIHDLISSENRYIIIKKIVSDEDLERIKRKRIVHLPKSNSTTLDTYIINHYAPVRTFGRYTVYKRYT